MDDPLQRKCDALVKGLLKRSQGVHFSKPVDWKKMGLHDYPKLIKQPMDLGTVAEKVARNSYPRLEDFSNEVRLVWVRRPSTSFPLAVCTPTLPRFLSSLWRSPRARRRQRDTQCVDRSCSPPARSAARLREGAFPHTAAQPHPSAAVVAVPPPLSSCQLERIGARAPPLFCASSRHHGGFTLLSEVICLSLEPCRDGAHRGPEHCRAARCACRKMPSSSTRLILCISRRRRR